MIRPIQRTAILMGALLLLSMAAAACAPAPTAAPTAVPPPPTALPLPGPLTSAGSSSSAPAAGPSTGGEPTGASLYELSCAACHGSDRAGKTLEDEGKKIEVPALGWDDLSKMYSTDPSRGSVADQLALAITKGQSEDGGDLEPAMPKWSTLSNAQVDSLVQYLQNPGTGAAALGPDAMSLQGEQLYVAACSACHGADGAGKSLESEGVKIDTPSLSWADLSKMYATDPSRGTPEQQAALAITQGKDETGEDLGAIMPRWSFLSQAQVDSLVQYLQTTFK